jgi:hypothetical protein
VLESKECFHSKRTEQEFKQQHGSVQEYPAPTEDSEAELLVANEIAAHKSLQQQLLGLNAVAGSEHVVQLLGTVRRPLGRQVRSAS